MKKAYEYAEKEYIEMVRKANRKKARIRGPRRKVPHNLKLPRYIDIPGLSKLLNRTMLDVTKKGNKIFDWWPNATFKTLKKTGYRDVKSIVLNFEEAQAMCKAYDRDAHPLEIRPDPEEGHEPIMLPRPCVVSIMGHVDHGKTTLMDRLRGTNVASREPGGITQDTYCFLVDVLGNPITFLDTPGHRVFTSMRDNAAFLSDLAVIVVDVNEGVESQTLESVHFAVEHNISILPAITKVDDGLDADPAMRPRIAELTSAIRTAVVDAVKEFPKYPQAFLTDLKDSVVLSAKTGWNVESFKSEMNAKLHGLTMKADVAAMPYGAVIEAFTEGGGRGNVITVVLWQGSIRKGDYFAAGLTWGKVKQIQTSERKIVDEIPPGIPVQIMGVRGMPDPGDDFMVLEEQDAISIATERQCEQAYPNQPRFVEEQEESIEYGSGELLELDELGEEEDSDLEKKLNEQQWELGSKENPHLVIVKADKQGTLEPLLAACQEPFVNDKDEKVFVQPISSGLGAVTKADVMLADAAGATIQCFRVKPPSKQISGLIKSLKVETNLFDVYFDFLKNIGLKVT